MAKYTRWSPLLVIMMSKELKEEFFADNEEATDEGWDLFETLYPEKAEALYEVLKPRLKEIEEYMDYQRRLQDLMQKGKGEEATKLTINYRASKMTW